MAEAILVTSWDDGHPTDARLAEMLARRRIAATFFAPIANTEGLPVMTGAELRELNAAGFEVAAHTSDHRRLTGLSLAATRRSVIGGKARLEDILGRPVTGFAYPGGRLGPYGRRVAAEAGFLYARTTRMFDLFPGADRLALATTAQFHPHGPAAVIRNWLRHGGGAARLSLAARWLRAGDLLAAVTALADAAVEHGGVFHLWGHGWEIDRFDRWDALARTLEMLTARFPPDRRMTVAQMTDHLRRTASNSA